MKIYFDLDGVLVDFDGGVRRLCKIEPVNLEKHTREEDDAMWDKVREVPHFYDLLEPNEEVVELFRRVHRRYGDDCQVLTGIPKAYRKIQNSAEDKRKWVAREIGEDVIVTAVYRSEKKNFINPAENCILIDDFSRTIREWGQNGGIGIRFRSAAQVEQELKDYGVL